MKKKTLVIGASENPERYSNKAIKALRSHKHSVIALAPRQGKVEDVEFITRKENIVGIHTVTLYISPKIQPEYYQYVLDLKPERVIFNPGTENPEFIKLLEKNCIKAEEACTLVLLAVNNF